MPRKPRRTISRATRLARSKDYVVVSNRSYGNRLKGTRIYFEGRKPAQLRPDGSITFGKHILETLGRTFERFRWIITLETDSVTVERGITRVRTSQALLRRMGAEEWDRKRDIKNDIVRRFFSIAFPTHFTRTAAPPYVPGTLATLLDEDLIPKLSGKDRDALTNFIPAFVASESVGTVSLLKASAQIETLKELAANLDLELDRSHGESWWQDYIKRNILLIQQGYIKALEKMNVTIGTIKFPDFSLITHDNYIDILEIKKPDTPILKHDGSRGNYYWDSEMARALIQTENYIDTVGRHADAIRSHLRDTHQIDVKAVRPRGIILAGDARRFQSQKEKDDFRLLAHSTKNITVLTYDELLTRLTNYIHVLEDFSRPVSEAVKARRRPRTHARHY
jgi:hypothetical protein